VLCLVIVEIPKKFHSKKKNKQKKKNEKKLDVG
jgi:hypothetical protein